jgi:hypothetical protein
MSEQSIFLAVSRASANSLTSACAITIFCKRAFFLSSLALPFAVYKYFVKMALILSLFPMFHHTLGIPLLIKKKSISG